MLTRRRAHPSGDAMALCPPRRRVLPSGSARCSCSLAGGHTPPARGPCLLILDATAIYLGAHSPGQQSMLVIIAKGLVYLTGVRARAPCPAPDTIVYKDLPVTISNAGEGNPD
jgi:hypothetical protein